MAQDKKPRKASWRKNHSLIITAYLALIEEFKAQALEESATSGLIHGRKPTLEEVHQYILKEFGTKISVNTIHKHIQEFQFIPDQHHLRILTDQVILAVFNGAMDGNPTMAKLWFQLFNPALLMQRIGNADGSNLQSLMILPGNARSLLPEATEEVPLTPDQWQDVTEYVKRLEEKNE